MQIRRVETSIYPSSFKENRTISHVDSMDVVKGSSEIPLSAHIRKIYTNYSVWYTFVATEAYNSAWNRKYLGDSPAEHP